MDDTTIETYNRMSKQYDDETAEFWLYFPKGFIELFSQLVGKNKKVLNVGSGPGRDAELLKKKDLLVTCLDASQVMVSITQAKGFNTVQSDLTSMPLERESFDGVWAYTSLLHIRKTEMQKAIDEIRRVLKPGGILALGMIEGTSEEYKESSGVRLPRLFSHYTKEELETLFATNGFTVLHFESYKPRSKTYLNFIFRKA